MEQESVPTLYNYEQQYSDVFSVPSPLKHHLWPQEPEQQVRAPQRQARTGRVAGWEIGPARAEEGRRGVGHV